MFEDGRHLIRERFVKAVRPAVTSLGLNSNLFAGHSFRIGATTVAAQQGVQDSLIKTMGAGRVLRICATLGHRRRFCVEWQPR